MNISKPGLSLSMLLALSSVTVLAAQLPVGMFSTGSLAGWEPKSFVGEVSYQLVPDPDNPQQRVLKAHTRQAASGLFRKISIDLEQTPYLNWRWRVDNIYSGNNEHSKEGDDYPARVYVVVSGGVFFWRTRALNFVWSSHQQAGDAWTSPYTDNAKMVAVDAGDDKLGQWREHRINVREALNKAFGKDFTRIDAVALMSDSDNAKGEAVAWYGDIWFSGQ